jgi:hypothetical protein
VLTLDLGDRRRLLHIGRHSLCSLWLFFEKKGGDSHGVAAEFDS